MTRLPTRNGAAAPPADNLAGSRSDRDNQKIIENLRARHEALKSDRIRTEHDLATQEQALAAARQQAREAFGTDDIDKLRDIVRENRRKNTEAVDAYVGAIETIEQSLAALPSAV